ncbi:DHH family phosphoesterase [Anaeromicropila populeti]|nr:DHH family phosphoesterase [Anaeromicropila populeti]
MKLVWLLRGHKIYIQTHNFPDPDAISSAFGLQNFLKYYEIESILCYDGKIDKLSTKRMLKTYGIHIFAIEELADMREEDYIVMVDAQKYNSNLTDCIACEVACIDHHPTFIECDYLYKDIRIHGACASMIGEYFYITKTPMDPNTAAALTYGIKMDTSDFSRGVTDLDIDMFAYLYKLADKEKLSRMYNNVIEFADLHAYGAAIESISVYDKTGFAAIPFNCPDALIATISDFILALDVVDVAVVYAKREDGIKCSVRSERYDVNAGKLTNLALMEYGNGGGHFSMAGGFIPLDNVSKLGHNIDYKIRMLFLDAMKDQNKIQ